MHTLRIPDGRFARLPDLDLEPRYAAGPDPDGPDPTIAGAGHFLREDAGPEFAATVAGFVAARR